jgi:alkanesulfonate monooxygenase SsuD/methylene tetrahydromethanopterin reductase-like flavin-dependent oxidoreductase (luciferase family)
MSAEELPAVALVATPGRWRASLDLAREIERRGFHGIYSPSLGDSLALCEALALVTERIRFGTSIVNLYLRHPRDYAQTAAVLHELSGGRFDFGVGVSHAPLNDSLGVQAGKPLADMRRFVEGLRSARGTGPLPPVVLAALRDGMVRLAGEVGDGLVFANAARSHLPHSLGVLPSDRRADFFVGNMIPVCISDDVEAAAARNRKTMDFYLRLPNYRRYWKAAGYVEEMQAVEKAIESGESQHIAQRVSERWLADCTLYGPASRVREGVEAWREAGVSTPIVVPSSAVGNQLKAFEELFAAYA